MHCKSTMSLEIKSIFLEFVKSLAQNLLYFLALFILHLIMLHLFVLEYFTLYFVLAILIFYGIYKFIKHISYVIFFSLLLVVIAIINTQIYEEIVFEAYLHFNATHLRAYVSSEVFYALLTIHIIVLINLKKFEKIWAIMDKKLFRD